MLPKLRAATCHISPSFLSSHSTTSKTINYINRAASNSANLVVFPESSIPGFPIWSSILPPTQTHQYFHRLSQESLYIDGDEISSIRETARTNKVIVSLGFSEKVHYSTATLFNSNLLVGQDGKILVHHRKLVPTFFEKLSWSPGDGHGLRVAETASGKIGALICGENTNPLARYTLMAQGEQVHISTWPAIWPTRVPKSLSSASPPGPNHQQSPFVREATPRNYDNVTANRTRAAAHCFEAKCFGIMNAAHLSTENISSILSYLPSSCPRDEIQHTLTSSPPAASMYLDPTGAPVPGFIFAQNNGHMVKETKMSLQREEDVLYADLDLGECVEGKQYHDVVGGYQRFDVFKLQVNRERREGPVEFVDEDFDRNDGD